MRTLNLTLATEVFEALVNLGPGPTPLDWIAEAARLPESLTEEVLERMLTASILGVEWGDPVIFPVNSAISPWSFETMPGWYGISEPCALVKF